MNERPTYEELEKKIRQLEDAAASQQRTESKLKLSEERLRLCTQIAGMAVWEYDFVRNRMARSDNHDRLYGLPPQPEWVIETFLEAAHPDDREFANAIIQKACAPGGPDSYRFDFRVVWPDESIHWLSAVGEVVERDQDGQALLVRGCLMDITRGKDVEHRARASDRQYHRLFQKAPVPLWEEDFSGVFEYFQRLREAGITDFRKYFDANPDEVAHCIGKVIVLDVNDAALRLHEAGCKADLLGQLHKIFSDRSMPVVKEELIALARGQLTFEAEGEVYTLSGDPRQVYVRLWLDPQPTGQHKALLTTTDITERKTAESQRSQLEAQLHQAQKMESIGTLAGGIAHDFNNILSAVLGYTELSLDEVEKGSRLEDNLQEVFVAGQRAKELVNQILTFARRSEGEKKPVQVSLMAKEVLKLLRSSLPTSIEIRQDIRSKALVMGDPGQIHQVFMNLCTNAGQAMGMDDGVLRVSLSDIRIERRRAVGHGFVKPGDYILITVADTGTGIPVHHMHSIFEPYFTTKEKGEGTGLGLAVVHGAVQGMGGEIAVESQPGKGTVFTIYLPITRTKIDPTLFAATALPVGDERILFVDDEAPIVRMGQRILEKLGYRVTGQTSSVAALGLFEADPSAFDLVITDMTMPGMTGDDMATAMLARRPDIPIILCTGYSKKMTEASVAALGIKTLAYKPIVKADLAKTVRDVLDAGRSAA